MYRQGVAACCSWSPVLRPDFRYYVLYRKEGREGTWEKIVSNTTSNVYIDTMRDSAERVLLCRFGSK